MRELSERPVVSRASYSRCSSNNSILRRADAVQAADAPPLGLGLGRWGFYAWGFGGASTFSWRAGAWGRYGIKSQGKMSVYQILGAAVVGLVALGVGLLCLIWPERVRDFALRTSTRFTPFRGYMKTRGYIWSLRGVGVTGLLMFIMILAGLIWGRD